MQQHRLDEDEENKAENGVQKRVQLIYTRVYVSTCECEEMARFASALLLLAVAWIITDVPHPCLAQKFT